MFALVTGVSLYVLLPSLLAVFSSWRSLTHLVWYWTVLAPGARLQRDPVELPEADEARS